jgi:hypothetical protein
MGRVDDQPDLADVARGGVQRHHRHVAEHLVTGDRDPARPARFEPARDVSLIDGLLEERLVALGYAPKERL